MQETTINKWINSSSLKWARERMGLKPNEVEDLSKHLDIQIKASSILSWENNQGEPQLNELEILADIYACPVGYFTQDSYLIEEMPLNYRGLAESKIESLSYQSRLQLRRFVEFTQYLEMLTEQLEHPKLYINKYSTDDPVETIANTERDKLGISLADRFDMNTSQTLFYTCRRKLGDLGIYVLSLKLNPKEVRGASIWKSKGPPSILVNDADVEAAAGRIFTLLHEYAHLLFRETGIVCDFRGRDEKTEIYCNKFAAEMLVPKNAFMQYLESEKLLGSRKWWSDYILDKIRKPFLASRDVIAILLEEIDLAPKGFYLEKAKIWDSYKAWYGKGKLKTGHRRTKFELMRNKLGDAFTSTIISGHDRGIVSSYDLAELLDTRIEKVDEFLKWARKT